MSKSKFKKKEKIDNDIVPATLRNNFESIETGREFSYDLGMKRFKFTKMDHTTAKRHDDQKSMIFYPDDEVIVENDC